MEQTTIQEIRNSGLNLGLALHIYESNIEVTDLTNMTQDELSELYCRTDRDDLKFEIRRLRNKKAPN